MSTMIALAGGVLILLVLQDAFVTMLLPRRVTRQFRFARMFYVYSWAPGPPPPGGSDPTSEGTRS